MLIRIYDTFYPIVAIMVLLSLCALPVVIVSTIIKHRRRAFRLVLKQVGLFILVVGILFSIDRTISWTILKIQKPDRDQIDGKYTLFQEAVMQENFEKAYDFMAPEYRHSHSLLDFQKGYIGAYYFPPLNPNRFIRIRESKAVFSPDYDTQSYFWQDSITLDWVKIDSEWYLSGQIDIMLE